MIRTSSLEVSIKIYIDCALDIFSMLPCLLCLPICDYIGLSMYFYYCTHCCVCQLDTKENDDDDDDENTHLLTSFD